jgi:hypothetical protein
MLDGSTSEVRAPSYLLRYTQCAGLGFEVCQAILNDNGVAQLIAEVGTTYQSRLLMQGGDERAPHPIKGSMLCSVSHIHAWSELTPVHVFVQDTFTDIGEDESFYKLTVTREEGFSTPKTSSAELTGRNADMILAPTFAIQ